MKGIQVYRFWYDFDVHAFCARHGFYTCGTNEEFSAMLAKVTHSRRNPNPEILYDVAKDILDHSDTGEDEVSISDVMTLLERETVATNYSIEGEN